MTMKNFFVIALVMFGVFSFAACKKDSGGSGGNGTFTYKENNGSELQMPNAEARSQYKSIFASEASNNPLIEINLTSLSVGDYTIGSANQLSYLKGTSLWTASGGTVKITNNANGKLSGNFISQGVGITGVNSLSGTFTDIEIK